MNLTFEFVYIFLASFYIRTFLGTSILLQEYLSSGLLRSSSLQNKEGEMQSEFRLVGL